MPLNYVKGRGISNPVWPLMQLQEENGILSEEKFINMVGDAWGSKHVILYGANGEPIVTNKGLKVILVDSDGNVIFDSSGFLTTKMERRVTVVEFTIPNGQSLSPEIDIGGASMGIIHMPGAWTAANITFRIRRWGAGTAYDLYNENGSEVVVTAAAGRAIPIPPEVMAARYIIVRSGTTGTPVNQGAARDFELLLKG